MAGLGGSWGSREEFLHPRDRHGRFRKKWQMAANVIDAISSFLERFSPRTFQSDGQSSQYLFNRAKPGRFGGGTQYSRLHADYDEAQQHLRDGDIDAPTQKFVKMMDDSAINLDSDLIMSQTMGPDAFGLTPETIGLEDGGLEDFTGRLIADRGYRAANVGTPLNHGPGKVTMTIAVPKGTKAIIPARSQNDRGIFLDRDQELRITKVKSDGRGGFYVMAVATPRTPGQTPEPIDRGPRGIGLSPQEREARVLRGQQSQSKREGIQTDASINEAEIAQGTQQAKALQPAQLPPAQGPPPTPGEPPPRNEPVVHQALGGPDTQGKGTAEIAQTPQVPNGPPAPGAPPTPQVPPPPTPDIRRAVREAGIPSPSAGPRRREWNNAYLGVASGKKNPEDMLRELETDINRNRHLQEDDKKTGRQDPHLADDIKAQDQLADAIAKEYGLQRTQGQAPAKKAAPSKVTPIGQAGGEKRRELPGEAGAREVTSIKSFKATKAQAIQDKEERKRRLLTPEPEAPAPQKQAPKKVTPAKVLPIKKAAPAAPVAKKAAPATKLTKDEQARDAALGTIDKLIKSMSGDEEANRSGLQGTASPIEAIRVARADIESGKRHPRSLQAMLQTLSQNRKDTPFGNALADETLKLGERLDELGFKPAGPGLKPLKLAKKAAPSAPAAKKATPPPPMGAFSDNPAIREAAIAEMDRQRAEVQKAEAAAAAAPDLDKMTKAELLAHARRPEISANVRTSMTKDQIKQAIRRSEELGPPEPGSRVSKENQLKEAGLSGTVKELQIIADHEGVPRRGRPTNKAKLQEAILANRAERANVPAAEPNAPAAQKPIQVPDRREAFADDWLNTPVLANIDEKTAAGRSINEVRDDILKGRITPDEGIRRLETDIELNKSDLADVEQELRGDVTPPDRSRLMDDRDKLRKAISDQENASSFMRKHFRKAPAATPDEIKAKLDDKAVALMEAATPDQVREAGKIAGFGELKGDNKEELLQDLIRKVAGKELESRRAAKKAAPKKLAPAPLEPKKATTPGHVDARLLAEGLEMDEDDQKMLTAIQEQLDSGKVTPAAVGRTLAKWADGPAGPSFKATVIKGVNSDNMTPELQREFDANNAKAERWRALADRLQKTRRPSAKKAAPPAPSTKLTPDEKKTTKAAAELLDVPAEKLQAQVVAKRTAAAPPSQGAQNAVDAMNTMQSREEGQAFLKNRNKTELLEMAKAVNLPQASRKTTAELRRDIVDATIGHKLDSIATRGFVGTRPPGPKIQSLEDMSLAELADLEGELGIKRTTLDRGERIAAIRAKQAANLQGG